MNKLFLTFILGIMLLSLVSAGSPGENIGTYQQDTCVKLPQSCSSCSYSKISSIISPNQTIYAEEVSMTRDGTFFYYDFCNTSELGKYKVNGHFDVDGVDRVFNYVFEITYNGNSSTINLIVSFFLLSLVVGGMLLFNLKIKKSKSKEILLNSFLYWIREFKFAVNYLFILGITIFLNWIFLSAGFVEFSKIMTGIIYAVIGLSLLVIVLSIIKVVHIFEKNMELKELKNWGAEE